MVNKFTKEEIFAILYELRLAPRHQLEEAAEKIVEAAANKAAEEGGLLHEVKEFLGDMHAMPVEWTIAQSQVLCAKVSDAIAADRTSRHVASGTDAFANKSEVEEKLGDYWMDKGFLQWVHDRLRFVHKENENVDYMHKLRSIIASFPDDRKTPNVASIATPPATTGASTVLTDERIDEIVRHAYWAGRMQSWGGFKKDDDGKYTVPMLSKMHYDLAREVAAQAGQVAVPVFLNERELFENANMKDMFGNPPTGRENQLMFNAWQERAKLAAQQAAAPQKDTP